MIALQLEQLKQQQHIKLQQQKYQQQVQQHQLQQIQQLQQQPQFLQAITHESSVALELSELSNLITPKDVTISTGQQTTSPNAYQHEPSVQQQHLIQQQLQEQTQELQQQISSQSTDLSEKQQFQEQQQLSVQTFDVQTTEQSSVVTEPQSQAPTTETAAVEMTQSCGVAQVIEQSESSSVSNIQQVQPQAQLPSEEDLAQEATNNPESSLIRSDSNQQQQSPQIQLQQTTQLSPPLIAQSQQIPSSPVQSSTETTTQLESTTPTVCAVTNSPSVLQQQRAASIASNQSPTLRSPLLSPSVQLAQQQQHMLIQQQRLQYQPIQLLNLQNPTANNMVIGK